MIEAYLKAGAKFPFSEPNTWSSMDVEDRAGFKTITNNAMTLQIRQKDAEASQDVSVLWLPWQTGFITETVLGTKDVLSGPFSGCWMLAYIIGAATYVAHIGTSDWGSDNTRQAKVNWRSFAPQQEEWGNGCNPSAAAENSKGGTVFGVYTTNGGLYRVICECKWEEGKQYRQLVGDCTKIVTAAPKTFQELFKDDAEIAGLGFTLEEWKKDTSGGLTRSDELKALDVCLGQYLKHERTLANVQGRFRIWREKNPKEYNNPKRRKNDRVQSLEQLLKLSQN